MTKPLSLEQHFSNQPYLMPADVVRHALEIHSQIPLLPRISLETLEADGFLPVHKPISEMQKPAVDSLNNFEREVLRIAPDYFNGKTYDAREVVREISLQGKHPNKAELSRVVKLALDKLKNLRLIEPLRRTVKIRDESPGELSDKMHLMYSVVYQKGHTFLPRYTVALSHREMCKVGKAGLKKAAESMDPEKPEFFVHATNHVAAAIAKAAREDQSIDLLHPPRNLLNQVKRELGVLMDRRMPPHVLMTFALARFGRHTGEIYRHFNVPDQQVKSAYKTALRTLEKPA